MIFEDIEYLENLDENLSNIFGIILSIKKVLIIDSITNIYLEID